MVLIEAALLHKFEAVRLVRLGVEAVFYESESVETSSISLRGISVFVIGTSGSGYKALGKVQPESCVFEFSDVSQICSFDNTLKWEVYSDAWWLVKVESKGVS